MKVVVFALLLLVFTTLGFGSITYAYDDYERYYQERRAMEEAELEQKQIQGDIADHELESKVAAAEAQEEKESAEAAEANKQLLINIGIGTLIAVALFFGTHWLSQLSQR